MSIEALAVVLNHSKAKGTAKVVLLGIANHLGPDAEEGAWPSQARLANYANVSDRAVREAIQQLEALGELRVELAQGISRTQYKPNRYWIELRCPDNCDRTLGHNRVELSNNQGGSFLQSGWKPASYETTIKPLVKPVNPHLDLFPEFWKEYPLKKDKGAAFRAFKSALNRAKFEDILAGVIAYKNDPTRKQEFTKYPATWLNADAWENAVTPSTDSVAAEKARERREREREATRKFLEEQQRLEAQAAPPPTCEHGLNLARCNPCLSKLGKNGK